MKKLQKENDLTYSFERIVYEMKSSGVISEELADITKACLHQIKNRICEAENK